jgi:hypothetical protein
MKNVKYFCKNYRNINEIRGWRCSSEVQHLLSMWEAVGFNLQHTQKKGTILEIFSIVTH